MFVCALVGTSVSVHKNSKKSITNLYEIFMWLRLDRKKKRLHFKRDPDHILETKNNPKF